MNYLTEISYTEFADALASKAPVPGGGSAAALAGALGAALCSMVGNFTLGKKKYADVEGDIAAVLERTRSVRTRLMELIWEDALAFEPLSKAYAIPKNDPGHDETLEEAAHNACKAPMDMTRSCAEAIVLLEEMEAKGSRMLLSDVGCGAFLCKAAMESAALNVLVNTRLLKNQELAAGIEKELNSLLAEYLPRADNVAQAVVRQIREED